MPDWTRPISDRLTRAGWDVDVDIVDELAQHAEATYQAARAEGLDETEAAVRVDGLITAWAAEGGRLRRASRRAVPPTPPVADSPSRTAGFVQDVRYAWRLAIRKPVYALLVVGTMALGIAATTTLFSVTYGVLMKPLPFAESDRLVVMKETRGGHRPRFNSVSNAVYHAWTEDPSTIDAIAAWSPRMLTLTGAGDPERIRAVAATASLFDVLRVGPLAGVFFQQSDEIDGGVVVLSDALWRQRFGADPGALGRGIELDGVTHRIVGILPASAGYPDSEVQAWVPFRVAPTTGNSLSMFEAIARLRPGVTPSQAAAEATGRGLAAPRSAEIGMTIRAIFGEDGPIAVSAMPLRDAVTADVRRPLVVLLAAVVLLFLTATANVASLQLAQSTTRRRELAIRAALGARGSRVTRQLLVEGLLLASAGGASGLALAGLAHRVLPSILPADFPRLPYVGIDWTVAAFAVGATMAAGVAVGLLPALQARRINLVESLAEDGAAPAGAGRTRVARARTAIMVGQVAIACVLLVGATLLGRSFRELVRADRGFDPTHVLTARVQMPTFAIAPERRVEIADIVSERLRAMPGVTAVTISDGPVLGIFGGTAFWVEGRQAQASARTVSPGYFAAMGVRILDGRDFTEDDIASQRAVFIVNRAFARQYLGPSPVGQRVPGWVRKGRDHWEIIAVVDDVRHRGVTEPAEPEVYTYRERDDRRISSAPTWIVRTSGDPSALAPLLRAMVREQDPTLIVDSVMTMEERVLAGLARPRLYAILLGGFAGLALLIATVGLLAVLSYSVAQRSRELAVRMALGARRSDIVRLVAAHGLGVGIAGLIIGLPAAMLLTRAIGSLLFGVRPGDAFTYAVVAVVLLAASLAACVPPAVRATRIDPLRLLRAL